MTHTPDTPDGSERAQRLHLDAIDGLARATQAPKETVVVPYEAALAELRVRARIVEYLSILAGHTVRQAIRGQRQ